MQGILPLWHEFPDDLMASGTKSLIAKKIAGVKIPILRQVIFSVERYSLFGLPAWIPGGIEMLKSWSSFRQADLARRKVAVLERAEKKPRRR